MNGLSSILSLLRGAFDKFNNTRARMLHVDSIYHICMTVKMKSHFWRENVSVLPYA